MGSSLEVAKLVCASWLKANWERAPWLMKSYMTIAVIVLMIITSMGIFGFLSKAHSDQSLVSGDVQSRIAIYDEKIRTAKDNIDANRKALKQMDEAVDQVMGRSQDEKGADKAVAIRRAQQKERVRLQSEIAAEQKTIAAISEERAPIAAEVRKVEAEVGPIKYIAKFIYGDNGADENMLERAVTWIIILIVVVFDPLAVIMLLAAQMTFQWHREEKNKKVEGDSPPGPIADIVSPEPTVTEQEDELAGQEQAELARLEASAKQDVIEESLPIYVADVNVPEHEAKPPSDKLIWEDSPMTPNLDPAAEEAVKWAEENKNEPEAQAATEWAEEESKKKNSYMMKEQGKLVIKEQK
jgi:hypothetical protein